MDLGPSRQPPHPGDEQQRQQFTTVGSVWHPQSLPMQPPMRRGRSIRAGLAEPYGEDSLENHPYHTRPPPYYTPLQQNSDRAVSPPPRETDQLLRRIAELERQVYSGSRENMPVPAGPLVPYPHTDAFANPSKQDRTNSQRTDDDDGSENLEEDDEVNTLNNMSTKTLTNLASYSNPMQKAAQKILTRARQVPPTMQHQASDSTQDMRGLPPPPGFGLGNTRTHLFGTDNVWQSDGAYEYRLPNQPSRPANMTTTSVIREYDAYPAVLSKGPGAPQPLKAGPPGYRQLVALGPMSLRESLQESKKQPYETESFDDSISRTQPYQHQPQRVAQPYHRQSTPSYRSEAASSAHPTTMTTGKEKAKATSTKVVDTLNSHEAAQYFPRGLPADFNRNTTPVPRDWPRRHFEEVENQGKNSLWVQQTPEFQAAHKAKLENDFYSGGYKMNKDFPLLAHENRKRDVARFLGSVYDPEKPTGKVVNRQITVNEANAIPTSEHAKPLLSMMYQSITENPGFLSQSGSSKKDDSSEAPPRSF
ncbi:hypothetical protein GGS26DRAFT_545822 [Hypomontagnella submonticulosa]|nr:hypothetical protein GGS26DRAFT_545822 [Hypomontagnella submonticulosa]